jgi:serralysin
MAILYISPTGAGLGDGSSSANAGTLSSLSKFIGAAGAGGEVRLLADQGAYHPTSPISITQGGTTGAPATIHGVDSSGNAMAADFVGTRPENWTPTSASGNDLFRLMSGANNLHFEDLSTKNFGDGVFRIGADISNLSIEHVQANNVTRFIEDYVSGTNTTASVNGLTVQDVNIQGYSQGAIRLQYDSSNILIQDVKGDNGGQEGGLFMVGVHLEDTVHNVVLSRVEMDNNNGHGSSTQYWNGDGFATERGVYNIRFEDTVASGNTDAGYDLKSSDTILIRALADGNTKNFRLWSDSITVEDSTSLNPRYVGGTGGAMHVWMAEGATVTIENFHFSDAGQLRTLFDLMHGGATLYLKDTVVPLSYNDLIHLAGGSVVQIVTVSETLNNVAPPPSEHAPTAITVSGHTVDENATAGTFVATLAAVDPDADDSHSFAITGGASSLFEIVDQEIHVKSGAVLDYETQHSWDVTITATDQGGLSYTQVQTINLNNVQEVGTSRSEAITGGTGDDTISAGAGSDSVHGGAGCDDLRGDAGQDKVYGGDGNDTAHGGAQNDKVYGEAGDDLIYGDSGNDFLWGGAGNDNVAGGAGRDALLGGDGDDRLNGGTGLDILVGGAGNDSFVFDVAAISTNADKISDFTVSEDKILLSHDIFADIGPVGALSSSLFALSNAPGASDDRIIYNSNTGGLYYDPTGGSHNDATLIVTLTNHPTNLTADDIVVV